MMGGNRQDTTWGYFENLFLMRTYQLIAEHKLSKEQAIKELCATLHKWASSHTPSLRSEEHTAEEVAWQLERIGYLVNNPELPTSQKFMKRAVQLYREQPVTYAEEIQRLADRGCKICTGHFSGDDMLPGKLSGARAVDKQGAKSGSQVRKEKVLGAHVNLEQDEAFLLVETCVLIKEKKLLRLEGVHRLSDTLRARANIRGYKVENTFRNYAGIGYCVSVVLGLLAGKSSSFKYASKIFKDTVWLYKNLPEDFNKEVQRLHEAGFSILSGRQNKPISQQNAQTVPSENPARQAVSPENASLVEQNISACFIAQALLLHENSDFLQEQRAFLKLLNTYEEVQGKMKHWLLIEVGKRIQNLCSALTSCHPEEYPLEKMDLQLIQLYRKDRAAFERILASGKKAIGWEEVAPAAEKKPLTTQKDVKMVAEVQATFAEKPQATEKRDATRQGGEAEVASAYRKILREYFTTGYRVGRLRDQTRFASFFEETYGRKLPVQGEALDKELERFGQYRDGRIFAPPDDVQRQYTEQLLRCLAETLDAGASCLYVECIYAHEQSDLQQKLDIFDAEALTRWLQREIRGRFLLDGWGRIYRAECPPNPEEDIRRFFREQMRPLTYDEVSEALWYLPMQKIKQTIRSTQRLLLVENGTYMDFDAVPLVPEDWRQIHEVITAALSMTPSSHLSREECRAAINDKLHDVASNTESLSTRCFMQALKYQFGEEFSFSDAYVSMRGAAVSPQSLIEEYLDNHSSFTLEDFSEYLQERQIPERDNRYDILYARAIRLNEEEFVSCEQITFDVAATDEALERFGFGDFVPLRSIASRLSLLPQGHQPWTVYLLESFVYQSSEKYRLLHHRFLRTGCTGAIVRRDSGIEDYDEILMRALALDSSWHNKEEALRTLADQGYLERARYDKIERLLPRARRLRAATEDD